ncbi:hypothetical protein [Pontixanthobacter luteolus]|uniref:hypothetical protein n=1 Tax=Pontixanthobacter luteolus TaxID=295089 RepID=UPI0023034F60|nr:hypothetical protein [Pontixanthobacter luteolus]
MPVVFFILRGLSGSDRPRKQTKFQRLQEVWLPHLLQTLLLQGRNRMRAYNFAMLIPTPHRSCDLAGSRMQFARLAGVLLKVEFAPVAVIAEQRSRANRAAAAVIPAIVPHSIAIHTVPLCQTHQRLNHGYYPHFTAHWMRVSLDALPNAVFSPRNCYRPIVTFSGQRVIG